MNDDKILTCRECGTRFIWTAFQQRSATGKPDYCPGCIQLLPGSGRQRGTIKFFNARRGWGFIIGTGGGQVFFHRSGLQEGNKPGEGDLVEFAVEATSRGPQATGIISL